MSGDPDNDDAKYEALAEEMRQEDLAEGLDPVDYGPAQSEPAATAPRAEPQYYEQHQRPDPIPDAMEDPIAHFDQRLGAMEQQRAMAQIADAGRAADVEGRQEYEDYNDMVDHLHKVAVTQYEQQLGRRMSQPEREHYLAAATLNVMERAAQHGVPIATYARHLALESGYRSTVALGKSEFKRLSQVLDKAADTGDYDGFDRIWDAYAKAEKGAERTASRRRR